MEGEINFPPLFHPLPAPSPHLHFACKRGMRTGCNLYLLTSPLLVAAWPCLCLRWCPPSPPPVRHVHPRLLRVQGGRTQSPPLPRMGLTPPRPCALTGNASGNAKRRTKGTPPFFSLVRAHLNKTASESFASRPHTCKNGATRLRPNRARERGSPRFNPLPLASRSRTRSTQAGALPPLPFSASPHPHLRTKRARGWATAWEM